MFDNNIAYSSQSLDWYKKGKLPGRMSFKTVQLSSCNSELRIRFSQYRSAYIPAKRSAVTGTHLRSPVVNTRGDSRRDNPSY